MVLSTLLFSLLIVLLVAACSILLFDKLGLGSVVGFIVAGIILGPHTPGLIPGLSDGKDIAVIQDIAELGVVLFMFTVGLEMQPKRFWAMRTQLFGLGFGQIILTTLIAALLLVPLFDLHWQSSLILAFGISMSSTAVVMSVMTQRSELSTPHGRNMFAVLMSQDMAVVPFMALLPLLGHVVHGGSSGHLGTLQLSLELVGVLVGILILGKYILPKLAAVAINRQNFDAFGLIIFMGIITAAWAVDKINVSMTLGAFLLGVLLSASDYRYQIASSVEPFKQTLMGLFFLSIGMSIDIHVLADDGLLIMAVVAMVILLKTLLITLECRLFRYDWSTCLRTGLGLSQVGEFSFVLFTAAAAQGLMSDRGVSFGYLIISITMILTPAAFKLADFLSRWLQPAMDSSTPTDELPRDHYVVVGLDNVGMIIALMLQKAGMKTVAIDKRYQRVLHGKHQGFEVHFGDVTQEVVMQYLNMGQAKAVFISTMDHKRTMAVAMTLKQRYPGLKIYARVNNFAEQSEMMSKGIVNAGTAYVESSMIRGVAMLVDAGLPTTQVETIVQELRAEQYKQIKDITPAEELS